MERFYIIVCYVDTGCAFLLLLFRFLIGYNFQILNINPSIVLPALLLQVSHRLLLWASSFKFNLLNHWRQTAQREEEIGKAPRETFFFLIFFSEFKI